MNTRLTLADCRAALERFATPSTFTSSINQVCERLIYSGKWKGNVIKTVFDSSDGFITLPPYYLSVMGTTYNHWPTPIFGEFHTYFESGPGTPLEASAWLGQLQDMGDGFCSQSNIITANPDASPPVTAQPGSIRLMSTGSDNGLTVRLFGIVEETGLPVTDNQGVLGEEMTLTAPWTTSANHYSELTDVIKATTKGPVQAWVAPTGGGASYQIAAWQPGETRPRYRRYMTGRAERAIEVLCQRRFFPVSAETDWVIPGNLAALKFGLKALRLEDSGYEDKAAAQWATAVKWLNDEATASRGGAAPSIPAGIWGPWNETIPQQH